MNRKEDQMITINGQGLNQVQGTSTIGGKY